MKELLFDRVGVPQEVLYLKETDIPEPNDREVLIRVKARNINPSDLLFVRGMYGITPKLPSCAGFEASGVVEKGDKAGKLVAGTRVMFTAIGTWKEYVVVPQAAVLPIPDQLSDEVACQAFVNPMTAFGMIEKSGIQAGQWLLLTAGASAFGKFAIQMAKAKGIHVVATVRHDSQKQLLKDLGADLVINSTTEKVVKLILDHTTDGVDVVFDAVGGELGVKALSALKPKGRMLVFGALALENLSINSGLLIFKNLVLEGFWLSTWMEEINAEQRSNAFKQVFEFLMGQGTQVDVAAKYSLDEFKAAITAYEQPGRNGKILLVSE